MYQVYLECTEDVIVDIFLEELINHYSIDGKYDKGKITNVYGVELNVITFVTIYDPFDVIVSFMENQYDVRCEKIYSLKDKKRV